MHLTHERIAGDAKATLGILFRDGVFECFTLEDAHRPAKVRGATRIPAGIYRIGLRTEGGLSGKYAERFPDIHRGMLWLRDVPGFNWIYLHVGNTEDDTEGCILVGDTAAASPGALSIGASRQAYRRFYQSVVEAAAAGELTITITDRDRGPDGQAPAVARAAA